MKTLVVAVPVLMVTVRAQSPAPRGGTPDLISMLKENKKAVLGWYYSDQHMALMLQFGGHRRGTEPLANVPDDGRPILAIASVTFAGPPRADAAGLTSVPQIAIELYAPLPGGLAAGGRFAPASVHVPGMVEVPAARPAAAGQ